MSFYSTGPLPDEHANCAAPWECFSCGKSVCPNHHPSKGEFTTCAECFDFIGGAA